MSEQRQDKDHVVVIVQIKRVTFTDMTGSTAQAVRATAGVQARTRQVGDVLSASVTGSTVEQAVKRAVAVMGTVDDETPSTSLKHSAMRETE